MCVCVWGGGGSISDCHMIRHRDGGGGVVSVSDCHMIRHRNGVGGGVWFLSPTVT